MNDISNTPPVSIILTVRERSQRFEQSLQSVTGQSYRNLQIIVAAVTADEMILQTIEKSKRQDLDIVYLPLPEESISQARNIALKQAYGTFVLFMTEKQEIQNLWIERGVRRLILSGADGVQCATMYLKNNVMVNISTPDDSLFGFYQRLLVKNTIDLNSMIVKRAICAEFPERIGEDAEWEFWLYTLRKKKVDVQSEIIGSIVHVEEERFDSLHNEDHLEIMKKYFKELHPSIRKVRQYLKIRSLEKELSEHVRRPSGGI
ncbi:MAG: glycosyltransferase family 2 protein [Sphaerochaetaceae bacterium]|nr:glycosyltransferase family 2 protein [Sphaerochaetaceae bacterium]